MLQESQINQFIKNDNSLLNGYIIPIKDYPTFSQIMKKCPRWNNEIPFAYSAFGDLFVVDNEGYIILYAMVDNDKSVICADSELFFQLINDIDYQKDYFNLEDYESAVKKCGKLEKDECYTYEPIPALGGDKNINNIQKGKIREYLSMIVSFMSSM